MGRSNTTLVELKLTFTELLAGRAWLAIAGVILQRISRIASAAGDLVRRLRRLLRSGRRAGVRVTAHHLLTDNCAGNSGGGASPGLGSQRYRTLRCRRAPATSPAAGRHCHDRPPHVECGLSQSASAEAGHAHRAAHRSGSGRELRSRVVPRQHPGGTNAQAWSPTTTHRRVTESDDTADTSLEQLTASRKDTQSPTVGRRRHRHRRLLRTARRRPVRRITHRPRHLRTIRRSHLRKLFLVHHRSRLADKPETGTIRPRVGRPEPAGTTPFSFTHVSSPPSACSTSSSTVGISADSG